MWCGASLRLLLVVLFLALTGTNGKSRSKTNNVSDENEVLDKDKTTTTAATTTPVPAIVAIEIIDPNENKTSNKNSKRTIESSLGYGFQSFFGPGHQPPRFQIYKYSQHDIPPYKGKSPVSTQNFQITKSVSYDLPTQTQHRYTSIQPTLAQYYKPGTTLYSTINHQGQIGGLSSNIPYQQSHQRNAPIPVIILRVHPDHLKNPNVALYPQLPQSNPYSGNLNSINLQSLLSNYIENMLKKIRIKAPSPPHQQEVQQEHQNRQYLPVAPQLSPEPKYLPQTVPQKVHRVKYLPPQVAYQQVHQHQDVYQQIPQQQQIYQQVPHQQEVYQQEYQQPAQHQNYDERTYHQQPVYQQTVYQQEPDYHQQDAYPVYHSQIQYEQPQYHQSSSGPSEHYSGSDLLTHENYPDEAHTRVIFRTEKGHIKTTTRAPKYATPTETKVIKITIPNQAFSSVEVQTPESQYAYRPGSESSQKVYYEDAQNGAQPQYYYTQEGDHYRIYQQQGPEQQQQVAYEQEPAQYVTQAPQVVIQPKKKQNDRPTRRSRSKKPTRSARPSYPVKEVTEEPNE